MAMFQSNPNGIVGKKDEPKQTLSLLDLQIRQPGYTSQSSSTQNRKSAEPAIHDKPQQQTTEPTKKEKDKDKEVIGAKTAGQIANLFKEMHSSIKQKKTVPYKKNKKQQEKE